MEEDKLKIEKFDGKDFGFWKMQIEDYLYQKNLYLPLTSKPSGMKEDEWKVLDRQVLGVIRLTLAKSVAYNVKDVTTTVGVIKALSNMYEKPSAMNKFDEEVRALILLSSLPRSWDTVVVANRNSSGKSKLKCDDVRDLILSESLRRKNSGESSGGAYSSEGRGRGRQQRGAPRGRSNSKGRNKSKGKEIFQNFKNGKFGKVYLADDEPLDIMGKGDVMIKTSSGRSWKLEDVRYIPKLRKNFISVGQLDSRGFRTMFGEGIGKCQRELWWWLGARRPYKDNFGGKSVEKESIGDGWEFVELDGEVRSGKEVEQEQVEVPIQQASPQLGAHVPVDLDSSDSDDDDHLETNERVVTGEPIVLQGEPSTPPTVRRSSRPIKPPNRYSPSLHYLFLTDFSEPECYQEAMGMGFIDSDFGGCYDSSKSTLRYVYTTGDTTISWMRKLQKCVSMSKTEVGYVAMSEVGKEMEWLKGFLEEMGMKQDVCALYSDSQSAVQLAKNPMFHYRTKHIKRRYHYTRSLVKDGKMYLRKIAGSKNPADMLTKVVSSDKLRLCRTSIGLHH
uniref:Retrovirus-related Pol polyprotein from transposon TNT 1-94-like beta-barrel domain-containing protein n=1 Tax=Chenopodium quinoa TaxID=63459 RepID=A0A803KPS4_CHEQI